MGILLLAALGAALGWLSAILRQHESNHDLMVAIASGMGGALLAGALASESSLLTGISPRTLALATLGSIAALGIEHMVRREHAG